MTATLTDIRLFVATYEERSFTAAAARENATQSGVSQHIAKLERRFQVRLFTRAKGRVDPTPAADAYYARCLDVLRTHAAAGAALTAAGGGSAYAGLAGEIAVGLMPTMTRSALAPALNRFTAEHGNVTVRIVEAYSGALTRDVRAGVYDFAIVPAFEGLPGILQRPFLTTSETLVARAGDDQTGPRHLQTVRLADLGPLKLVLPGPANTRRKTLATYFAANGVAVERTIELDAMMGTLDTVARSDWLTVLPGVMMAGDIEHGAFRVNPIVAPPLDLDLVVIEPARRAMSVQAAAFYAVLEAETRRLDALWRPSPAPALAAMPEPALPAGKSRLSKRHGTRL